MKKFLAVLLCAAMIVSLAACGQKANVEAPVITGVSDQSIPAGTSFDAMAGIAASDAEDGDLTGKIVVTSLPALTFAGGKATPENPGDYELTYTVTDAGGLETKEYATLTVTRQTGEAEVLMQMDFTAPETLDNHGWEAVVAEGVDAVGEMKEGAYVFTINNPGNGDGDIKLAKAGLSVKSADYKVKVWAKATANTYAHLMARNEQAEGWETFGGTYNAVIGENIAPVELNFTAPAEGSVELLLHMGKITPNPENPADTTPENVTVTIDKIEIYEISGSQTEVPAYTADFASAESAAINAGDGANASVTTGDAAVFQIANYPTEGGVWSIKADLPLTGVTVEEGAKYFYRFNLTAENAQGGECLVESAAQADACRANFNGISVGAGETVTVTSVFVAEKTVEDPVIRMQIGNPSEGAASNTLTVTDLVFGKMEGDLETIKTIDSFGVSSTANTNPNYLWTTFNGTDEDNDRGVGTLYMENGKLYYRIDQGGNVDWHNKLILGHRENPLTLPADSYFIVSITGKASQNVSCGFFLNPMGGWDPRVAEGIDFTTEEQTFTFKTTDPLILDMDFEMLFQFGSAATAEMGSVTIEISDITISQESII